MERNKDNILQDSREKNPKYNRAGLFPKLQQFEVWIYRMMDVRSEGELIMKSNYLPEVADKELFLQPAPQIYCLYDFVDEFLEEGGIEVSYSSNKIHFKPFDVEHLRDSTASFIKEKKQIPELKDEEKKVDQKTIGLIVIGWGTAIVGFARGNKIEEINKFRASQLGRYDWTRFSSKDELDWWIKREKREAYRNICRIASSEFQSRIKNLDYIIIGLKKLIIKESIDLAWFNESVKEKITNIYELDQDSEPNLRDLLSKNIENQKGN